MRKKIIMVLFYYINFQGFLYTLIKNMLIMFITSNKYVFAQNLAKLKIISLYFPPRRDLELFQNKGKYCGIGQYD